MFLHCAALSPIRQRSVQLWGAAGIDEIGDASVYGTLRRLYSAGVLSSYVVPSEGGPHRKYYGINDEGRAMLGAQRDCWNSFASIMAGLLDETPAHIRTLGEKA